MESNTPDFSDGIGPTPLTDILQAKEGELPKPNIKVFDEVIDSDIESVRSGKKIVCHNQIPETGLVRTDVAQTRFSWGNVDNKVVVYKDPENSNKERRVLITTYRDILESFGDRVGNGVDIWLTYDSRNDSPLSKNMTGEGGVVVIRESLSDTLDVWYVVDGGFKGMGKTGSIGMEDSGRLYTTCKQLILHDKSSNLAVDLRSCLLPMTELRYSPLSIDSPRSMSYFAQGTGKYLQFQNIGTEERFSGILHEIGHEWLEILDPKPSVEATQIMNNAVGGISRLEEKDRSKLAEILPGIEKGASDMALNKILSQFESAGMKLQVMRQKAVGFLNKGLESYEKSMSTAFGGTPVKIEHFEG